MLFILAVDELTSFGLPYSLKLVQLSGKVLSSEGLINSNVYPSPLPRLGHGKEEV